MGPYYFIVNQCMKHLDGCALDSLKRMQLDTDFFRLKRLLLDDERLLFLKMHETSIQEFDNLLVKTRLLGDSPHDHNAIAALEEQVKVIISVLQLPGNVS